MMYKGTTNYKLLGAYVARKTGYSSIDFFSKKSLNLNIFSTREDSTVKKVQKCLQEGAFGKNYCSGALI